MMLAFVVATLGRALRIRVFDGSPLPMTQQGLNVSNLKQDRTVRTC